MHNYKVGSLVTVVDADGAGAPIELNGKTGSIESIWTGGIDVEFADGTSWAFCEEHVRPGGSIFIVVDEEDNITAEHRSLEAAERDAKGSAAELGEGFTVYQRIVSFGVKTEVVETRG